MSTRIVFHTKDVATLAGFTALYFSGLVAGLAGVLCAGFAMLALPTWSDGSQDDLAAGLGFSLGFMLIILAVVLATAIIITVLASVVAAPIAGLLGLALRRVRSWPIHLVAYFAGGALVAIPVALYLAYPILNGVNIQVTPSPIPLSVVMFFAGASTAAGWATAWRIAVKRFSPTRAAYAACRIDARRD
jgi:hypothetical protein